MGNYGVLLLILCILLNLNISEGFGTFGFDVHHRYSDTVKDFMDLDGLPEKGTLDYYTAMAHRDQLFKARHLASTNPDPSTSSILTFFGGNRTYRLDGLGFLHYSIVDVGTPALTFLVALDTGSDLFWLPCDCTNCVRQLNLTNGDTLDLNMYNLNTSSSSSAVPCNSTLCGPRRGCALRRNACAYQLEYLSSNTSSTGILVDDVLHLGTDHSSQTPINAPITFGCGIIQTGGFLETGAINGLFGLGMDSISVPSLLASRGLTSNSFSMCFGRNGLGRIEFGDKGSPDQNVTRFNLRQSRPTYNITVSQIVVGINVTNIGFTAIFDSGTSITLLSDPAYSFIAESFNSQVTDQRYQLGNQRTFQYCYALSPNQSTVNFPVVNLIMNGGSQFSVNAPTILIPRRDGGFAYCLAIVRSGDINIIGQNFMTGYRIVFDREEMHLGWRESDCYDAVLSNNRTNNFPIDRNATTGAPSPSPMSFNPEATPGNRTHVPITNPLQSVPVIPASGNNGISLSSRSKIIMVIISLLLSIIL